MTLNIAVLVSGRGSNLQSIIDNIENGYIKDAAIRVVVSDKEDAYALERARNHGINAEFVDPSAFSDKDQYESRILEILDGYDVELLLLAGYMRLLGGGIVRHFKNRIINIHPALLPSFKGLHAQKQALEHGVKVAGCTVHFVDEDMDSGPIILQKCVPVLDDDTEDSLAERILREEHRIYPEAVKLYAEGRLDIKGRIVSIS
ncbi:phosphoribosylglycinamide formyltransferase-1 [Methanohalophilus levihalophilus]|uniref:phosphoribosylglycinamide formyltransferase n=1 Tax=Methanohalophilus levihalophilus TaxID=1431282 RepID=UPI001AEA7291|nr:phosphoribosylglycinamide formyltransferase [Methanohalophilus levihalophilus]MBP2030569.1 phosphoribosylglycinamide formyltransferase-1 [Methanohalophilus levihalophilus]